MSLLSSKTCSSVAQMCHCEAVELCVVLDAAPCFFSPPSLTHAISFWWAHNQYTTPQKHITTCSVARCPRLLLTDTLHG